jgi:hypothetical protein
VVSTEKWRWWRVPAAGLAREGAAVVCADIDGAAPETAVAQIRAIGGRPTGIAPERSAAALSAAPAEEHNGRVQGVQGLGRCGESAWRKFNDNLLRRFQAVKIRFRRLSGDTIRCHDVGVDKRLIDETEWGRISCVGTKC